MRRKTSVLVALFAIVFGVYQLSQRQAQGQTHRPTTVQASFGRCVGYAHVGGADALIFEGVDGTIRLVNLDNSAVVTISRSQ